MKVCEIYKSIQGESSYAGYPCVFVRLVGCNLRCTYCDTRYAYEGGTEESVAEVLEKVDEFGADMVLITGGEPMLQDETVELAELLLRAGRRVLVETNGSIDLKNLPEAVVKIMDIKTPGSGFADSTKMENLELLSSWDMVKFVITSEKDFEWAVGVVNEHLLDKRVELLFSPAFTQFKPETLAKLIVEKAIPVRLNLQIHKYIWSPDARGV